MFLTQAELAESSKINPEILQALSKLPKPVSNNRVTILRQSASSYDQKLLARLGTAPPGIDEVYHYNHMRDGSKSSVKIVKPSSGPPGPLIVLFFSGAFIAGTNNQLSDIARALALLYGATVVSVSYRLSPEYKFPIAQEDAIDSVRWAADNAVELGADLSKGFLIGGASSGGNLAAVLSRYFQNEPHRVPVTGQWISIAALMDAHSVPLRYRDHFISREQNASAPILNAAGITGGTQATQEDPASELRFPVNSKTPLSGQPRTYIQCCGLDPYRDDGLIYDEMLKGAGVATKLDFYPGCPHGFWLVVPGIEASKNVLIDIVLGHGWLLEKSVTREQAAQALSL